MPTGQQSSARLVSVEVLALKRSSSFGEVSLRDGGREPSDCEAGLEHCLGTLDGLFLRRNRDLSKDTLGISHCGVILAWKVRLISWTLRRSSRESGVTRLCSCSVVKAIFCSRLRHSVLDQNLLV